MTLKKHRESVFKSFRENKKEIKRAEKDIKWKDCQSDFFLKDVYNLLYFLLYLFDLYSNFSHE